MSRMRTMGRLGAGLAVMAAAGACKGDSTGPGDSISMDEAQALIAAVWELVRDPKVTSLGASGGTFECPGGGQFKGEVAIQPSPGSLGFTLTITPADCKTTRDGKNFTLDGNPSMRAALAIAETDESVMISGTSTGGVRWKLDSRSGSCAIDLKLSAEGDALGGQLPKFKATGTLCGHTVDFELEPLELSTG